MGANETVTRITRALGSVTSIFRCHGLQRVPANADRIGGHDLLYWSAFLTIISAWYLFLYMPQCRRFEKLQGRQQAVLLQLESDKKELARLKKGIASLAHGDALAWERAARKRLGWLEPGEVLDLERWRATRSAINSNTPAPVPQNLPPILPRPRVPQIPRAAPVAVAPARATMRLAECGALGPTASVPPAPPPMPRVPVLPPRNSVPVAQRVSIPAAQTVNNRRGRS